MIGEAITVDMPVEYAVFCITPAAGWPADYRRLRRTGNCALTDLEAQAMSVDEQAVCVETLEETIDGGKKRIITPVTHAVQLAPHPRLVAKPEAG